MANRAIMGEQSMNKENKVKEIVILSVLILVLVIVAVVQLSPDKNSSNAGTKPDSTSGQEQTAAAPTTSSTTDAPAKEKNTTFTLAWVDEHRLSTLTKEVVEGRDPFRDPLAPIINASALSGTMNYGQKPSDNSMNGKAGAIADLIPKGFDSSGRYTGTKPSQITPWAPAVQDTPKFNLSGIISTSRQRYASLMVDGRYYTLLEGESIPALGWTVADIESYYVIMKKDTQSLTLRLSGGSSK